MPIGKDMVGTRVVDKDGRTGVTVAYLPDKPPAGGYTVRWDDDDVPTDVQVHMLTPANGLPTVQEFTAARDAVGERLGLVSERAEGQWIHKGKATQSVLVVARPAHMRPGQELHAHTSLGGKVHRLHVKNGNQYVRTIIDEERYTGSATQDDRNWVSDYKLYRTMAANRRQYLSGERPLPS